MGRKKLFNETIRLRMPQGTGAMIDKFLQEGEDRSDFIRKSVIELARQRNSGELPFIEEPTYESLALLTKAVRLIREAKLKLRKRPPERAQKIETAEPDSL